MKIGAYWFKLLNARQLSLAFSYVQIINGLWTNKTTRYTLLCYTTT